MRRAPRTLVSAGLLASALLLSGPSALRAEHPNHDQGYNARNAFELGGIENVNLFNGNLNLTIPIGPEYPVGPGLSYRLLLSYTGNLWEWDQVVLPGSDCERLDASCYLQALPRYRSNAGLGWELTLGRFQRADDPLNTSPGPTYESPDQSLHGFSGSLHPGEETFSGVQFTTDSTYLRYFESQDRLELPDGTIQTFGDHGVEKIEDRFGNSVTIDYTNVDSNVGEALTWTITDTHFREHTVTFRTVKIEGGTTEKDDPDTTTRDYRVVLDNIELEAFDNGTARYDFSYDDTATILRACNQPTGAGDTSNVTAPLLTGISLPEGLSYTIGSDGYHVDSANCSDDVGARLLNGHLTELGLPTGGTLEWSWQPYVFPTESAEDGDPLTGGSGPGGAPFQRAAGIATRTHRKRDGSILGTWSYTQSLVPDPATSILVESRTTVTDPADHETVHYFNAYVADEDHDTTPAGYVNFEYGLPFTRQVGDGTSPERFLSREVYDKSGKLLRSVYVRYENSSAGPVFNPRLASRRTVYEDDDVNNIERVADLDLSDFDGLGHYRQRHLSGTGFPGAPSRTSFTSWNPGHDETDIPDPTEPWVLEVFDHRTVTQGSDSTRTDTCFDPFTGFLEARRTRVDDIQPGQSDVIVEFVDSTGDGQTNEERWYGADTAAAPTPGDLCDLSASATSATYRIRHDYSSGVRSASQYLRSDGTSLGFKLLDRTIDPSTGLVASSRDTAGLQTSFDYDRLGRLTEEDVQTGQGADTHHTHFPEGVLPARVVTQRKSGTNVLTTEEIRFDGFGRLLEQRRTMPDESVAARKTRWNALGWKEKQSEWEPGSEAQSEISWTLFENHDPFGRVGTITAPDGFVTTIDYLGERRKTTRVPVATGLDAAGEPVTKKERTTEFFDRFGRLSGLWEPDPDDGSGRTRTAYTYDTDNLTRVEMNVGRTPTQVRTFDYDDRGFLTSEAHPELGTNVVYSDYDPLGNAGRIQRGGWDLEHLYDAAGRLTKIKTHGSSEVWKSWEYATDNFQAGTWSNGKLATAARHNRVINPATGSEFDAKITEDYSYDGVGGRISHVKTVMGIGDPDDNTQPTYDYSLEYDQLGNVASRSYPDCSHKYCVDQNEILEVTRTFTGGMLTAIPGYASSITYHPNGLYQEVTHANGVKDLQANDPEDRVRPLRLQTAGASQDFDTGLYAYDGAGNVTKMGTDRYLYDHLSRLTEARVTVPGSPCGEILELDSGTDTITTSYESCGTIQAGTSYGVGSDGDVTLTAGNLVELTDGFSVASGGRLTAGTDPTLDPDNEPHGAIETNVYDRFGNREETTLDEEGEDPITRTFTTDSATNRLTGASYDDAGNVTFWNDWSYRWGPFGMMNEAKHTSSTARFTYVYAPGDERLLTVDTTRGTDTKDWLETWTLRDVDGTPLRQFRTDGGNTDTEHWSIHRDYVHRGGSLLAADTPEGIRHFHLDHLGSPRIVTDANGETLSEHVYYPFGEEASDPAQSAEVAQFTGHERDIHHPDPPVDLNDTDDKDGLRDISDDLDYMHARFHSPHLGRFFSVDPVNSGAPKNPQSWNRYSYTLNNPLNYVDPNGECAVPAGLQEGQVGICIEAFIAANRIGGIGFGDNRTFAPNDPDASARLSYKSIIEPQSGRIVSENLEAGISEVGLTRGAAIGLPGTADLQGASAQTSNGTRFTLYLSGDNGFRMLNRLGSIGVLADFTVGRSGGVTRNPASSTKGFPSVEGYSYKIVEGELVVEVLYRFEEKTADELNDSLDDFLRK